MKSITINYCTRGQKWIRNLEIAAVAHLRAGTFVAEQGVMLLWGMPEIVKDACYCLEMQRVKWSDDWTDADPATQLTGKSAFNVVVGSKVKCVQKLLPCERAATNSAGCGVVWIDFSVKPKCSCRTTSMFRHLVEGGGGDRGRKTDGRRGGHKKKTNERFKQAKKTLDQKARTRQGRERGSAPFG